MTPYTAEMTHDCRIIHIIGFETACGILADMAIKAYTRQITPVLYLFGYLDRTGQLYEEITLTRDDPKYAQLVILTHIPRDLDRTALTAWFHDHLRREPILNAVIR